MDKLAVTPDSSVEDVLAANPHAAADFVALGLPCFVCGEPAWGTVGELCDRHGKNVEVVLSVLNRAASGQVQVILDVSGYFR